MYYVYILHWTRYYVWVTEDLTRRLEQHKRWQTHTTKRIGEWRCVWYFVFSEKEEAYAFEREIKKSKNVKRYVERDNFIKY